MALRSSPDAAVLLTGYLGAIDRRLPGSRRARRAVIEELSDGLVEHASIDVRTSLLSRAMPSERGSFAILDDSAREPTNGTAQIVEITPVSQSA
jgi:hypothetical protein